MPCGVKLSAFVIKHLRSSIAPIVFDNNLKACGMPAEPNSARFRGREESKLMANPKEARSENEVVSELDHPACTLANNEAGYMLCKGFMM